MEDYTAALEQAFAEYRTELETCMRNLKPTAGLFGFGRSAKDDPCHTKLDERVARIAWDFGDEEPSPEETERFLRALLMRGDWQTWPASAQLMLRAVERHALELIPRLSREAAAALAREYAARYKSWDRLPAQQQLLRALKEKGSA